MSNRNIGTISAAALIDLYGDAAADCAAKEAYRETLKAEIIARGLKDGSQGKHYSLQVSQFPRWTLDADRIKEKMGEVWTMAYSKVTTCTRVVAKPLRRG